MIRVNFSPNAFNIFGIDIKWYAILYILSFEVGRQIALTKIKNIQYKKIITTTQMNDFLFVLLPIIVIGARAGHVIFYELEYYSNAKLEIFNIRNGGLSFHGGLIAASLYTLYYSRKNKIQIFFLCDILCYCGSLSLAIGRCANFINQELYGISTNSNFGVIFEGVDNIVRHPTQIYEALTEGLLNFIILTFISMRQSGKFGTANITIAFLINYSIARFCIDFFKENAATNLIKSGQTLSVIMFISGLILLIAKKMRHTQSNKEY